MTLIASDKHSYVIGLGETGLSCARFLAKIGRPFTMLDTRESPPNVERFRNEFPDIKLVLGELDASALSLADEIILSPGLDPKQPALLAAADAGVKIRGDIDLFAEYANAPIAAITGSNGKSTVTVLLGEMAKAAGRNVRVGGNLGTPALDLIDESADLYVMELSSFQLELVEKLDADVACLLNISEDHMDRYATKLEYLQAKQRIFRGAKTVVVNDDETLSQPLRAQDMKIVHYGMNGLDLNKFSYSDERLGATLMKGFEAIVDVADLNITGTHNFSNALAALAMGSSLGLPLDAMIRALKAFKGLPHRCEWVRQLEGVTYINDSKGTNGGACAAAIAGFGSQLQGDGKVVLIAGGEAKGALLPEIKAPLERYGRVVIAFGADSDIVSAAVGDSVPLINAETLEQAVAHAKAQAQAGDLVLFSPACASFDMFRNFEHRGDAFKAEVAKL